MFSLKEKARCAGSGRRAAFSLTELLVVVVILAILAGMAFVSYSGRRIRAEYKGGLVHVQAISTAEKSYSLSTGSYITTGATAHTNSVLGLQIIDGYCLNYRAIAAGGTFTITFQCGQPGSYTTFTFDANGDRTGCSGPECF